jgi:magnesium chelatase subunit I
VDAVLAGVEINDDPISADDQDRQAHRCRARRRREDRMGASLRRYQEKLATPDVTIADLIGEIDLVKHAEGRYLSDESTMHYG